MGVPEKRPLADFLPAISIKARDLAAEMTGLNVQTKDLTGQNPIEKEHVDNNSAVRKMLVVRGIIPESLPPSEDTDKVKRRLQHLTEHIKKVFSEAELDENLVCRNFRHTTQHGAIQGKKQKKTVIYYNFDVIISVEVKSNQ